MESKQISNSKDADSGTYQSINTSEDYINITRRIEFEMRHFRIITAQQHERYEKLFDSFNRQSQLLQQKDAQLRNITNQLIIKEKQLQLAQGANLEMLKRHNDDLRTQYTDIVEILKQLAINK